MSESKIANRLISGILTLIFSILFAFVFAEERQRGLAIVIAIPLAISLIALGSRGRVYLWPSGRG